MEGTEHAKGVAFFDVQSRQWPVGDDAGTFEAFGSGPVWWTGHSLSLFASPELTTQFGITLLLPLLLLVHILFPPNTSPLLSYYNTPSDTQPEPFIPRPHPTP